MASPLAIPEHPRATVYRALAWCLSLLATTCLVDALSSISVKGTKPYDDSGNQFFIKGKNSTKHGGFTIVYVSPTPKRLLTSLFSTGVAYSFSSIADPLLDTDKCQIDAGLIKALGANTIRVYTVDGSQNHNGCMQAFGSQGIYV